MFIVAIIVSLLVFLTGCSSAQNETDTVAPVIENSSNPVTLTVYLTAHYANPDTHCPIYEKLLDYQKENPNITIQFVSPKEGDTAEREAEIHQLNTEILSGKGPDLFIMEGNRLTNVNLFPDIEKSMMNGAFLDLTDVMDSNEFTDIFCPMYYDYDACIKYSEGDIQKPLIQCEYAHAMGNSQGGFKEYWDIIRKYPKYQGGFIWDFVDQSCHWKNKDGVNIYGYGGDFNKYDASDNNFNDNGLISPDRVPNPHAYEVAYFYQDIWTTPADLAKGEINIFNEYFFRDLSAYYMEWQLLANGEVVQTGIVSDLKVAPQQTVKVQIPLDVKNICPCKELLLNVSYKLKAAETLLPAGTTIAYDQLSIRDYKAPELKLENQQASNVPVIVPSILDNDRNYLIVKGENFSMDFNKHNGYLCRYDVNGMQLMEDGSALTPNFWRAPTDNDFGAGLQHKIGRAHV